MTKETIISKPNQERDEYHRYSLSPKLLSQMPDTEKISSSIIEPSCEKKPDSKKSSYFLSLGPEIIRQMPDHMEPGSLLHSLRCPSSYTLWIMVKSIGLEKKPKIYKAFYEHINKKHFGNG